tara:strand:- start:36 stop:1286 length:1251 start_codon:yes stop_codon:yes gene_type:complete
MRSYNEALKILKNSNIKIHNEVIKSVDSLNRVCSSNIYSKSDYPSENNTSLDGFALNFENTKKASYNNLKKFKIVATISAGSKPYKKILKKNEAIEIMTGGIMPKGTNTIIPFEECTITGDKKNKFIIIKKAYKKFNNVRFKGSDFKKKDIVVKKNTIINPNHIMAFKALGIEKIKVKKKLNVIFFSSGNEISEKNQISIWKIRNSNHHYLKSLNNNFLFNFKNLGILKDNDENKFYNHLIKILKSKTDIIITSGAVSAGKFDFIPRVINKFKLSHKFKNIYIRPGKPIMFAKFKGKSKVIFGLPGNPISVAACFRFFVCPYIINILSLNSEKPILVKLKNNFIKNKDFTRFVKSKLSTTKDGKLEVQILKGQESFRIKPFVESNIWTLLPAGKSKFKKGEIVQCFFPNHLNDSLI